MKIYKKLERYLSIDIAQSKNIDKYILNFKYFDVIKIWCINIRKPYIKKPIYTSKSLRGVFNHHKWKIIFNMNRASINWKVGERNHFFVLLLIDSVHLLSFRYSMTLNIFDISFTHLDCSVIWFGHFILLTYIFPV